MMEFEFLINLLRHIGEMESSARMQILLFELKEIMSR